ncbi:Tol-Pal system beta propeller repeat protein TolB [Oceanicella actignis]|uniref:Tol-Pal system protein TolB n=1 Tax=Oceanicella actignis TaxID=1189325 RepID=A0A1M7TVS4_9RHOB|nr:Tol-Pal system beta propeller repeat protein TolB [Oceanicella actignis]SES80784.1 TolB protein [Oceanicella actignis]SHN74819.1 TolB protein [Oceanicella actignis]
MRAFIASVAALLLVLAAAPQLRAQDSAPGPLRLEISEGVIEPMPIALPPFGGPDGAVLGEQVRRIVKRDLEDSGLFRVIDEAAYLERPAGADMRPNFANWAILNAEALIVADAQVEPDGRLAVRMQLWDVFGERALGDGLGLRASPEATRRVGHKLADAIHLALTGEPGYFDSRIAYVAETGPKNARVKRIAIMDQDGANLRYLTDGRDLVLSPRFSPDGAYLVYLSYKGGHPRVRIMDVLTGRDQDLGGFPGMTFAPRFSPDGRKVLLSLARGGDSDIYEMDLASREMRALTSGPGIKTSPSYAPDGRRIVFESDAGGTQQLYVMDLGGGAPRRISFGEGRYGTPVWSPRGDLIAFTKILRGRFHVGVMRPDGASERLLTASFLDEAPVWSPNGRVLLFFRETPGPNGAPALWRVDATGRNLRRVPTATPASDPSWSALLP